MYFYRNYISACQGREHQVKAFLNILTTLKPGWFKELISALSISSEKKSEHLELLELLEPSIAFTATISSIIFC